MLEFLSADLIDGPSFVRVLVRELPGLVTSTGSGDTFPF
jgi:hypothetical protein